MLTVRCLIFLACINTCASGCSKSTVTPPADSNLKFEPDVEPVPNGGRVIMYCNKATEEAYERTKRTLICVDNAWQGMLTTCQRGRCPTSNLHVPYKGVYTYDTAVSQEKADHLTSATLSCEDGYQLVKRPTDGRMCFLLNDTIGQCEQGMDCEQGDLEEYDPVLTNKINTHYCQFGVWVGADPRHSGHKCVKKFDLKSECLAAEFSYYYEGKCLVKEGLTSVRDVSAERECKLWPNGRLMTQKTQETINKIVDGIINNKTDETFARNGYELYIRLTENMKPQQTLRFKGHMTYYETIDSTPNKKLTRIQLYGVKDNEQTVIYQNIPLSFHVDHELDSMIFLRAIQQLNGTNGPYEGSQTINGIPPSLTNNQNFDFTITYQNENTPKFEIKIGDFIGAYDFVNSDVHYVNSIAVWNRGELHSATLDGQELRLADDDRYYTDCLVVGLIDANRQAAMDPKDGWIWQNGNGYSWTAEPTKTLWDTEKNEPDNKNDMEHYGCVNVHTKKLRDISSFTKRPVICEYEKEVTSKCYQPKGPNKRAPDNRVIKRETGATTIEKCAKVCNWINACQSFSINKSTGNCEVNLLKSGDPDMTLITDGTAAGYEFYDQM